MTTTPTLNKGQQAAADGFFEFLFSNDKELIISGPGGVGKTFLMAYMIDEIMPRYQHACALVGSDPIYNDVVMTATTNQAAEVLAVATGRPAQTIHSFMNLKIVDDYESGKSNLTKTKSWKIHSNMIIFVDESSYVDSPLLELIREGTFKCKIIYVGDHCQLTPITETLSPVYRQRLPFYELTEPMRTDVPALQALNDQLRETVKTGEFLPIKLVPGIIDLLDDDQMEQEVDAAFANVSVDARICAYTNQRVVSYNDHIRKTRNYQSTYVLGERLVNNTAVQLSDGMMSVQEEVEIIRLDTQTRMVEIEYGVQMEVIEADLATRYQETFTEVLLPVDKNHYASLIKYYQKKKNWNRYFHLKNKFPDLRPRDAATVHKMQGSSVNTIFIDVGNLSTCHNPNQAARLLYVAASRARHRVVFYGTLAKKYGGIIH